MIEQSFRRSSIRGSAVRSQATRYRTIYQCLFRQLVKDRVQSSFDTAAG
jgi:hypothetical protein